MEFSRLRKRAGLNIKEVAELTHYSLRQVYRWENGQSSPKKLVLELIERHARKRLHEEGSFTFVDLFAGIGGMRLGFEAIGGKCVFSCEKDRFSRKTYTENFNDHEIADDITKIHASEIPAHRVLLAGFPCQPFSIAGVSKKSSLGRPAGFACKSQGTLFFEIARILEFHRPEAFMLENVKHLQWHDRGRTFAVIRENLASLGYHLHWKIIDASSWVPQRRERLFIVGFLGETGFSFEDMEIPDPSCGPRMDSILHSEDGSEAPEPPYTFGRQARVSAKYTLSDNLWKYLQRYAAKHRARGNGFGYGLVGPGDVARTLSARYHKDGAEILVRQNGKNPRRLTPRECARLMGFDRNNLKFRIPVSDKQAYRQFGNAVVVHVVEAVARHMRPFLPGGNVQDAGDVSGVHLVTARRSQ